VAVPHQPGQQPEHAARQIGRYDYAILGAGLEQPDHPDHENTRRIISLLPHTVIFGYIDLGVTTSGYDMAEVGRRVEQWQQTGAHAVFYDDAGADYGVTRLRQQQAHQGRPPSSATRLPQLLEPADIATPADYYLAESWLVKDGEYDPAWRARASQIRRAERTWGSAPSPSRPDPGSGPSGGKPGGPPNGTGMKPAAGANPATRPTAKRSTITPTRPLTERNRHAVHPASQTDVRTRLPRLRMAGRQNRGRPKPRRRHRSKATVSVPGRPSQTHGKPPSKPAGLSSTASPGKPSKSATSGLDTTPTP